MSSDDSPDRADRADQADQADEATAAGGEPLPDGAGDGDATERDDEAVWREIVAHYGDRPELEDVEATERPRRHAPAESFDDELDDDITYLEDTERYIPPPPPPLPRSTPDRMLAWIGLLGTPVIVIGLIIVNWVFNWAAPTWLIALLVLAFLGGFGYLVFTMSNDPGDPWDDGARV